MVESADTGPSAATGFSFTIAYSNVPAAECTKIITAAAGNFYTAGVGEAGNANGTIMQDTYKYYTIDNLKCYAVRIID